MLRLYPNIMLLSRTLKSLTSDWLRQNLSVSRNISTHGEIPCLCLSLRMSSEWPIPKDRRSGLDSGDHHVDAVVSEEDALRDRPGVRNHMRTSVTGISTSYAANAREGSVTLTSVPGHRHIFKASRGLASYRHHQICRSSLHRRHV